MAIQEKRAYISPETGKVITTNANVARARESGRPSVVTDINGVQTRVYGSTSTLSKLTGKEQGFAGKPTGDDKISRVTEAAGVGKAARLAKSGLPGNAEPQAKTNTPAKVKTSKSNEGKDWRVKLSVPDVYDSPMFQPLIDAGGFVFPFTPSIILQHSANYNALHPTHTNYPFFNYQNSSVDQITISGEFFVENQKDARYWIAAMHYLRTTTKMFYGEGSGSLQGNPPPIVKLDGYGDYVFNRVPVIIQNFMIDMPQDVDYIEAIIGAEEDTEVVDYEAEAFGVTSSTNSSATSYVPTQCTITVTLQPIYSRSKVEQFNLNKFANGGYVKSGDGYI